MKLGLYTPIPNTVDLEFKYQACASYPHIKCEIQVIKLHAFRRSQSRKEALGHTIQICRERAHVDESFAERVGRGFSVASDEVVFDDEGLSRPEVACVVE
jgi:hypothetical protein